MKSDLLRHLAVMTTRNLRRAPEKWQHCFVARDFSHCSSTSGSSTLQFGEILFLAELSLVDLWYLNKVLWLNHACRLNRRIASCLSFTLLILFKYFSYSLPGTIDHHTVVYEYLDGRRLMSLKRTTQRNGCEKYQAMSGHCNGQFLKCWTIKSSLLFK